MPRLFELPLQIAAPAHIVGNTAGNAGGRFTVTAGGNALDQRPAAAEKEDAI